MRKLKYVIIGPMKEYLYIFNYPSYEEGLCKMEFKALFNDTYSKYYLTDKDINFYRSPFIRMRINLLCKSNNIEDLFYYVENNNLTYYGFKVIYLKNETCHVHYKESIEYCKKIALPINGSVNIHHPEVVIVLTKIHDVWILGIQKINDQWDKHEDKPYTYSSSLPLKIARSIVNIGVGNDLNKTIVDPCCGIGTVVLEALSMGLDIKGYDLSRDVSYQARLNLDYYDYNPLLINRGNIHNIRDYFDVCLLDIPYGLYSDIEEEEQYNIIRSTYNICDTLVLVSMVSYNQLLETIGYEVVDQCQVGKKETMDMIRYITLCKRGTL